MVRTGPGKQRRWAAALAVAVVVAVGIVVAAVSGGGSATRVRAAAYHIPVVDGPRHDQHVTIDSTLYVPSGVDSRHRAPAVIVAHGFGGSKDSVAGDARSLARHGYVVLAFSARGFGHSTGQVALDSPDYEVADVRQLVDWLARRPVVQLDRTGDPRVGITGGSYGGALALMAAAYDRRVDAIVPLITWNNLAQAFFRNNADPGTGGVFARSWAGLFFGGDCGRFVPAVCRLYQQAASTGTASPGGIRLLERSSPAAVLGRIHAPTMLIQGETDSLFGLDQAQANARGIAAAGTPVRLGWYGGGHDAGSTLTEAGRVRNLTLTWFAHWLRHGPDPGRVFTFSRINPPNASDLQFSSSVYSGTGDGPARRLALPGPTRTVHNPPGGNPAAVSSLPGVGATLSGRIVTDVPGQYATFESAPLRHGVTAVGAPRVDVRVSSASGPATLFAKLYDIGPGTRRELPQGLIAPLRVAGGTHTVHVRLPTIVHDFGSGHRLALVLATTDQAYATPTAPGAYQVSVVGDLTVPTERAEPVSGGDSARPWALAATILAALGLLTIALAGRRRRRTPPVDGLADVPLVVEELGKSYADGVVAVDDLSFRVDRGQVLGLLGPNGAGKTTTLRILMGLVHPSSGRVLVFGRQIAPGAAVLARVGAFVEGPGLLPHLSGLANLQLFWRATGRPEDDAHIDEALQIAGLGGAVHRRVRTYSHGMRQRLALAQAMLGLPELLVLDEPTNGLDPPQIRAFRDVLRNYAEAGRTVVVSSHLLAEVEQTCSHVVVMDRGRLMAAGTVREIVGSGDTLSVETDDPDRAVAVLTGLSGVDDARLVDGEVVVQLDGAGPSVVAEALVHAGLELRKMAPRRRLEDAFVSLIGGER